MPSRYTPNIKQRWWGGQYGRSRSSGVDYRCQLRRGCRVSDPLPRGARRGELQSVAEAAEAVVKQITGAGGQALALQADVSEVGDCKQLVAKTVEQFGQLDVLVNNGNHNLCAP